MKSSFSWKMRCSWFFSILLLLSVFPTGFAQSTPAAAPDKVEIRFVSRQMNVPVEGKFRKVKSTLAFDPAKPETAQARFNIDMDSIELGLEEAETEVKRPGWFNTAKYPTASFVSSSVKLLSGGNFEVAGKLTIKGITRDVTAPVAVVPHPGSGSEATGTVKINRLDYKIGEGLWADTDTVANEVQIKFKLALPAAAK